MTLPEPTSPAWRWTPGERRAAAEARVTEREHAAELAAIFGPAIVRGFEALLRGDECDCDDR